MDRGRKGIWAEKEGEGREAGTGQDTIQRKREKREKREQGEREKREKEIYKSGGVARIEMPGI